PAACALPASATCVRRGLVAKQTHAQLFGCAARVTGSPAGSERNLELEPGAQGAFFGLRGGAEQISRLVHELTRAKDVGQAGAAVEHRADAELLLIEPARIVDVLDLAVKLDARLEVLIEAVSRLPGIGDGIDRLGIAADLLLPEQIEGVE